MACATRSTPGCATPSTDRGTIVSADEDGSQGSNRGRRERLSRIRLVGFAGAVGLALGVFGTLVVATTGADGRGASTLVFSLGALAFGFALLGWSGSVAAGRSIEATQAHLDTDTGWTESGSRRAMARIGGFGAGVMIGASVTTLLV